MHGQVIESLTFIKRLVNGSLQAKQTEREFMVCEPALKYCYSQ